MTYPRLRATAQEIAATEARLGFSLDPLHSRLLQTGNGWPGTLVTHGDLFGTAELGPSDPWLASEARLDEANRRDLPTMPPRAEIYPIGAFWDTPEVIAIWRNGPITDGGHPVLWFNVGLTHTWPNLWEWWTDMLRSRRDVVEAARATRNS